VALIGMFLGAVLGLGIVQLLRGGRPLPRPHRQPPKGVLAGVGAGVVLLVVTGWPVLALAGGFLASQMLHSAAEREEERRTLARRAELARVASRLRDASLAGHGLPAAIAIAAAAAGPETRDDMLALARAVREVGVWRAFAAWGERAPDPIFGVFARMVGEADRQGSDALSSLLTRLATQTAKEVSAARETAAHQGGPRTTALVVAVVAVGLLLSVRFGSPAFAAAYSDAPGQVMMAAAFIPLGLGYWTMARLGRGRHGLSWGGPR
jgi:Flp pilus assembly protein TadB